tara:strand:- start:3551 stop:4042 length:492 start_codon:yes stop_codon:yes gene_type:complete
MNFNISELKTEFINKKYKLTPKDLPHRGTTFFDDKITVILSSKKTTLGFKIFGKLNASISYQCVRCLNDIARIVELPIKLKFDKKKNSYSEYNNENIFNNVKEKKFKVNNMIADMLELAKPNNPLCKKDCKGLCEKCGIQLNHESCKCNRININNPFYKLKFL